MLWGAGWVSAQCVSSERKASPQRASPNTQSMLLTSSPVCNFSQNTSYIPLNYKTVLVIKHSRSIYVADFPTHIWGQGSMGLHWTRPQHWCNYSPADVISPGVKEGRNPYEYTGNNWLPGNNLSRFGIFQVSHTRKTVYLCKHKMWLFHSSINSSHLVKFFKLFNNITEVDFLQGSCTVYPLLHNGWHTFCYQHHTVQKSTY